MNLPSEPRQGSVQTKRFTSQGFRYPHLINVIDSLCKDTMNRIDTFVFANVKVTMDRCGNDLVNTIETKECVHIYEAGHCVLHERLNPIDDFRSKVKLTGKMGK